MILQLTSAMLDTEFTNTFLAQERPTDIKKRMSVGVCDLCSAQLTHPDHYRCKSNDGQGDIFYR